MSLLVAMHEDERQRLHGMIADRDRELTKHVRAAELDRRVLDSQAKKLGELREQLARVTDRRDELAAENEALRAERDHALGLLEAMLREPNEAQLDAIARLVGQEGRP